MADFQNEYYNPMDREYEVGIASGVGKQGTKIEEPIATIGELGQTVPEIDPANKFKNMVQGVQAAMRAGAKNIQLVMSTPPNSPMGGRPKAYGKEVRQAMKEVFLAQDARLIGIEMPTAMNNLSGFDQQQGVFSETTRQKYMDEVKEAIRFASDVGQGGGVDIVSWEFQRPISAVAPPEQGFAPEPEEVRQVVEKDTGRIHAFRVKEVERDLPFVKGTKQPTEINKKTGLHKLEKWKWDDFIGLAEQKNREKGKDYTTPEEEFIKMQLEARQKTAHGYAMHYAGRAEAEFDRAAELQEIAASGRHPRTRQPLSPEEIAEFRRKADRAREEAKGDMQLAQGQQQEEQETAKKISQMQSVSRYAKNKSMRSYAELGIDAMDESTNNPKVKHPIHVGPEIGWPHAYGGHPEEFVELIKGSRKRMVQLLTNKYEIDPVTGKTAIDPDTNKPIPNPHFRPEVNKRQAEKQASEHIRGMFDTGHLGMWLEHFKPHLRYRERLKEFNQWFMKQVDMIAKSDVVGGIQAVDSAGAAHGHLPAGQGIFPVVEAVKKLKKEGFKGYIVSEGHEEEKFGEGRILLKTWQAFNSPIESKYGPGVPARTFNDIHQGYFGRTRPPVQMFGSYTPPFGEYKPWSEIPFE